MINIFYFAKNWNEVNNSSKKQEEPISMRTYIIENTEKCIICNLMHDDSVTALKDALDNNDNKKIVCSLINLKENLKIFCKNINNSSDRKKIRINFDNETYILIHFGQKGKETCILYTINMNVEAEKNDSLKNWHFISVSCAEICPEAIWYKNKLNIINKIDDLKEIFKEFNNKKALEGIPQIDHLRAIMCKCKTIIDGNNMNNIKGDKARKWWQEILWDHILKSDEDIWTPYEKMLISKNEELKMFCKAISVTKQYDFSIEKFDLQNIINIIRNII